MCRSSLHENVGENITEFWHLRSTDTNTTQHGHADTAFLKKVGHGHVGDTLIFNNNNNNISNHILKR